jgi:hypothetical protein
LAVYPNSIRPNETAYFAGHVFDRNRTMDSFDIQLGPAYIEYIIREDGLEVIRHNGSLITKNNETFYQVNGTLLNKGSHESMLPYVIGIFYDSDNNITHINSWRVRINYLLPGGSIDFEIIIYDYECEIEEIVWYSLKPYDY